MSDKRRFERFKKEYTIIFCIKDKPHRTYDMSRLLDISKGGLQFFSYDHFDVGTVFIFQIRFPFLYPNVISIEGQVVGVQDVLQGKTYKIHVQFVNVLPGIISILDQMERVNLKSK